MVLFASSATSQSILTKQAPLPCIDRTFTIVAHMVRDTFGEPNITQAEIEDEITRLNEDFAPICVNFEVCDYRFINNFQYDNIEDQEERQEMYDYHNEEFRINMYFISSTDGPFCGVATLSGITSGHYFGLFHTFEGSDGPTPELVDGSNCDTAGDLVCDTPADPYVAGDPADEYVDEGMDCRFIRQIRDGNNDWFVPDVGNIMSYYQSGCACGFTYGQYDRMAQTYLSSPRSNW